MTTPARSPVSSDATVTTVVIPITMPSTVSSERKRCSPTACMASFTFWVALIFTNYSARRATTGSSLAARDAGYQPETTPVTPETTSESAT